MSKHHGHKTRDDVKESNDMPAKSKAHPQEKALPHAPLHKRGYMPEDSSAAREQYTSSLHSRPEPQHSQAANDEEEHVSPAQQAGEERREEVQNSMASHFNMLAVLEPWVKMQQKLWMMMFQGWTSLLPASPKHWGMRSGSRNE